MEWEECFSGYRTHIWLKELKELRWKNTIETFARAVTIKILQTSNSREFTGSLPSL